jgi:chemotaxis protein histidine kinase CheA
MSAMMNNQAAVSPNPAADRDTSPLAPARARFRGLTIERILAFEGFRQQAEHPETAQAAFLGIRDLAHKISGVAATLGFAEAGSFAQTVEQSVIQSLARKLPDAETLAQIDAPLESLLQALETLLDA